MKDLRTSSELMKTVDEIQHNTVLWITANENKKCSAVEGFPSRDDRAVHTLGGADNCHYSDTPLM